MGSTMAEVTDQIVFLLKATKSEYVEDTMKKRRFCFSQPTVFSKWENNEAAQYDRWDSHSAYEATHLVVAPIISEENGIPQYGPVQKLADRAIIHEQDSFIKQSFICCFRYIKLNEVEFCDKGVNLSLGTVADRIIKEFGYDSFVLIEFNEFIRRIKEKGILFIGAVVYKDLLNDYEFPVPEQLKSIVEQFYRKDTKYEWQQEYRIVIPPLKGYTDTKRFIEIGSIEDIAISGKIADIRD